MTIVAWDGASAYNKDSYRAIRIDGRRFLSTTPITVAYLAAAVGRDSTYQFFQERERDFPDVLLRASDVLHLYDGDAFYGIPPCTMAGAALPAEHAPPDAILNGLRQLASEDKYNGFIGETCRKAIALIEAKPPNVPRGFPTEDDADVDAARDVFGREEGWSRDRYGTLLRAINAARQVWRGSRPALAGRGDQESAPRGPWGFIQPVPPEETQWLVMMGTSDSPKLWLNSEAEAITVRDALNRGRAALSGATE